jgi:hypothetical protein
MSRNKPKTTKNAKHLARLTMILGRRNCKPDPGRHARVDSNQDSQPQIITLQPRREPGSSADPAYLRLLEDALLWDECEKEGDNDLLNDLTLSNTDDNDSSDEDEERNNNTKRRRKVGSS